jgi:hypothetical protein
MNLDFLLKICNDKITAKGEGVQISFYVFFKNKNDDPASLMKMAKWWIEEHKLNHFEKATTIKALLQSSQPF